MEKKYAFLGLRRGGSSILFMLFQIMLTKPGLGAEDIIARFHEQGIKPQLIPREALQASFDENLMVGCFRECPQMLDGVEGYDIVPITVIRDPRDCHVSWFHAQHLHADDALPPTPIQGATLRDDLSEDDRFVENVGDILDYTRRKGGLVAKYEDIVRNPIAFFRDAIRLMGVKLDRDAVDDALMEGSFLQLVADDASHNRTGAPYAALHDLPRPVLGALNERFGPLLQEMAYPLWPDDMPAPDITALQERDVYKRFAIRLADQNGRRIADIERQQTLIEELRVENGFRIEEIRALRATLDRLRQALGADEPVHQADRPET